MLFNWFFPDRFEQYFHEGYLAGIGRKLQLFKLLINPFGCKQSALIKRVRDFVIQKKIQAKEKGNTFNSFTYPAKDLIKYWSYCLCPEMVKKSAKLSVYKLAVILAT